MAKLDEYVGRIVRLNKQAFQAATRQIRPHEEALDNCFVVAATRQRMRKLICYGADLRIEVCVSDVVLI